jgi:hypothetical protein
VQNGGNLIVLYNTPAEFDPNAFAPFPAQLPRDAEEVSEEDSPVTILAPTRPEFTTPNAIHHSRLRWLDRAARLEILQPVGPRLHADG